MFVTLRTVVIAAAAHDGANITDATPPQLVQAPSAERSINGIAFSPKRRNANSLEMCALVRAG